MSVFEYLFWGAAAGFTVLQLFCIWQVLREIRDALNKRDGK